MALTAHGSQPGDFLNAFGVPINFVTFLSNLRLLGNGGLVVDDTKEHKLYTFERTRRGNWFETQSPKQAIKILKEMSGFKSISLVGEDKVGTKFVFAANAEGFSKVAEIIFVNCKTFRKQLN